MKLGLKESCCSVLLVFATTWNVSRAQITEFGVQKGTNFIEIFNECPFPINTSSPDVLVEVCVLTTEQKLGGLLEDKETEVCHTLDAGMVGSGNFYVVCSDSYSRELSDDDLCDDSFDYSLLPPRDGLSQTLTLVYRNPRADISLDREFEVNFNDDYETGDFCWRRDFGSFQFNGTWLSEDECSPGTGSFRVVCFSELTTVNVERKGEVAMRDLQVGDKVQTSSGFQPVYAFAHHDRFTVGLFLRIESESTIGDAATMGRNSSSYELDTDIKESKPTLELSPDHLIFRIGSGKPEVVPASMLKLGDTRIDEEGKPTSKVTKIDKVKRRGAYAPLTQDGTIVTGAVLASTYVTLQENQERLVVQDKRGNIFHFPVSQHFLAHMWESPQRLYCSHIARDYCPFKVGEDIDDDSTGIPIWNDLGARIVRIAFQYNVIFQVLVVAAFLPLSMAFFAVVQSLDKVVSSDTSSFLLVVLALAVFVATKNQRERPTNKKIKTV